MENFLENRIVIVKPIPERDNPNYVKLDPNHDGKFMFTGCKATLVLPLSRTRGGLINFLTKEEQAFFEAELDMNPGDLSIYKKDNNYWSTFRVMLDKNELKLNLADAIDNLKYKLLLTYSDLIAPNWEVRNNKASYKWALVDEKEEIKTIGKAHDVKAKAYAHLFSIKDDKDEMLKYLKLLGKVVSDKTSREWLYAELGKIIENTKKDNYGDPNVYQYIELIEDKDKTWKTILSDAIRLKIIYKRQNKYYYDKEVLGIGEGQTISWLKDPENSETVKYIENFIKENNI